MNDINWNPSVKFNGSTSDMYSDHTGGVEFPGVGTPDDVGLFVVMKSQNTSCYSDMVSHPSTIGGAENWLSLTQCSV